MEDIAETSDTIYNILSYLPYESLVTVMLNTRISALTSKSITSNSVFWNKRLANVLGRVEILSLESCQMIEHLLGSDDREPLLRYTSGLGTPLVHRACVSLVVRETTRRPAPLLEEYLNVAIEHHDIETFKIILSCPYVDIQVPNHEVIVYAVSTGTYEMVELLLQDLRCDPSTPDNDDAGPNCVLWECCYGDKIDVFKLLLTDPRVDITDYNYGVIDEARGCRANKILDFLSRHPLTRYHM